MVDILEGAEPFAFEGNDIGVLVVHGFTGCPQSMRYLGEELHKRFGFRVVGPRWPVTARRSMTWPPQAVPTGLVKQTGR